MSAVTSSDFEIKSTVRVFNGSLIRFVHQSKETKTPMTCAVYLPTSPSPSSSSSSSSTSEIFPTLLYLSGLTCTDENVCQKCGPLFQHLSQKRIAFVAPDTSPRGKNKSLQIDYCVQSRCVPSQTVTQSFMQTVSLSFNHSLTQSLRYIFIQPINTISCRYQQPNQPINHSHRSWYRWWSRLLGSWRRGRFLCGCYCCSMGWWPSPPYSIHLLSYTYSPTPNLIHLISYIFDFLSLFPLTHLHYYFMDRKLSYV